MENSKTLTLEVYSLKPQRMRDKYGEIVGVIVDYLVSICLYPTSPTVPHWKERTYGLCKRFVDIDIAPISRNNSKVRLNCLKGAVIETLNDDYSAILNHFKTVTEYYANRPKPHERLTPCKPYYKCYEENKDRVEKGVNIASLSASGKEKLKAWTDKGYEVTSVKVSYTLAWRPQDSETEYAVCLANVILYKEQVKNNSLE